MFKNAPLKDFCPNTNFGLPSLSNGDQMFYSSKFGTETTYRILNSLPTYSSGTHKITLGIDVDYRYRMNEIQNTIDDVANKGWTLELLINGNATGNEVLNPIILEALELDNIQLPENYTRCLYLENNEGSYVDTGYIPSQETGVEVIGKSWSSTAEGGKVGVYSNYLYYRTCTNNPGYMFYYGYDDCCTNIGGSSYRGNGRCYISRMNWLSDRKVWLYTDDDVTPKSANLKSTITRTALHPMYIFATNWSGQSLRDNGKGRIYRVKISQEGEIVRDFIPCLDAEGKPCMYELFGGTSHYNGNKNDELLYEIYKKEEQ